MSTKSGNLDRQYKIDWGFDTRICMQSAAKEIYMLTEGDLKKLGSITRANPHKKDWSAMRLYMQSQVSYHTSSRTHMWRYA